MSQKQKTKNSVWFVFGKVFNTLKKIRCTFLFNNFRLLHLKN
uniref:Uncharacterized protein n=1 Tax=Chlorella vulgaris TaxID=3077 RepID=V9H1A1_CHLVU|nr:hypothetical protein ChvulCp092 [Chlorella vulgaris]pir/T07279/ pisatin demethylase homolog - Chlorella vulgaris chloroplast [Chlorella vulgaris]BAA57927.1 unnamed protein product [Chlorella vulgaris]